MKGWLVATLVLAAGLGLIATQASAHIERASYWPNPAPDNSIKPPTGGKVPAAKNLFTALQKKPVGETRVVCPGKVPSTRLLKRYTRALKAARREGPSTRGTTDAISFTAARSAASRARIKYLKGKYKRTKRAYRKRMARTWPIKRLAASIKSARKSGWKARPSEKARSLSKKDATRLRLFNERLLAACKFNSIQSAVNASGNNDRVVIVPGLYAELESRAAPTNDPKCKNLLEQNDKGSTSALSYSYQWKCPNDQNLVAIMGRKPGSGKDPQPPRWDRHGIPNLGACVRCNFQIEGSGVKADDVVIDAGRVKSGNKGPIGAKKDVVIRADRADGFVLRNLTTRHAAEHNIYILESDGYRAEYFKTHYPGEYGVLTFVEDHGLIQHCDATGAGDAGLYPGASADTGAETIEKKQRYSQELRFCDMHNNVAGYSGTTGNAVHVHHNDFYDNALGLTTDVFTASGHPGFPTDSMLVERNNFYRNNFNPFLESSDIEPTIPVPVGTGAWIAGGNNHTFRNNRFFNNWRRGMMTFTVPDAFVCGDHPVAGGNHQKGCKEDGTTSTSYDNRHYGNVMGIDPNGKRDPNGTDFWWDQYPNQQHHDPPTTTGNCWYDNIGRDGSESSVTSEPPRPLLPSNCDASLGTSGPTNESELLSCYGNFEEDAPTPCSWFTTPQEPQ